MLLNHLQRGGVPPKSREKLGILLCGMFVNIYRHTTNNTNKTLYLLLLLTHMGTFDFN